ncbi:MAG: hypothetical protein CMP56_00895 [Flavobacteriales bacterium]|nr:hypothetical protein [Flavobacteriales bacterium]|tara:strand:- start:451 stop:1788 length:1338 start_codon:yes stop_codon:yes gene_type:complete
MFKVFGDKIIWWISILLFLTSVLLVYSSGGSESIATHIPHLIMGLGVIFIFSRFNYKYFTNLSTILLILSGLLLLYLLVSNISNPLNRGGVLAARWIKLGFISFQPSELAKYSLILFLCRNLVLYKSSLGSFSNFFIYIILPSVIICGLIFPSNLSTVVLISCIILFLVFISGYSLSLFFKYLIVPLLISLFLFCSLLCLPKIDVVEKVLPRLTTWKNRIINLSVSKEFIIIKQAGENGENIPKLALEFNVSEDKILSWNYLDSFYNLEKDQTIFIITNPSNVLTWVHRKNYDSDDVGSNNYQIDSALSAIHRGGVLGKGAGDSYYKKLLPEAKSDFIFAILLEEYGLIGGCVVLVFYLVFYQRILILSVKSKDDFSSLLLLGLGTTIVLQALLHMSVSVNLIPVTGQTLPLVSKGGSSVWVTSLAFGIILNISHQINNQQQKIK